MKRINNEIRDDFDYFLELMNGDKEVNESVIYLDQKPTHHDWLSKTSLVNHKTINDKIDLIVERKKSIYKYGIKLTCTNLSKTPFFRFDSDGPAHRNTSENIPLSEQKITTPHFNTFDKTGLAIAYKSEILKQENEANAIAENIDFGISHFFQERNINTNESQTVPEIKLTVPQLFKDNIETDPLNGVDFII